MFIEKGTIVASLPDYRVLNDGDYLAEDDVQIERIRNIKGYPVITMKAKDVVQASG